MSVLMELTIFPTDKGASVSKYVSKVIEKIKDSGCTYKLTPMATVIETDTMAQALEIIQKAYDVLEPEADRIYSTVKFDIRKGYSDRITGKIKSIEEKIGQVNK